MNTTNTKFLRFSLLKRAKGYLAQKALRAAFFALSTFFTFSTVMGQSITLQTQSSPLCFGTANGVAVFSVSGFSNPFEVVVDSGQSTISYTIVTGTSRTFTNLKGGVAYKFVFRTNGLDTLSYSLKLNQPTQITYVESITNPTCFGKSDGSIVISSVTGGASPYTYNWSPVSSSNGTLSNLQDGIFTLNLVDNNNCTVKDTFTLTEPSQISLPSNPVLNSLCNGSGSIVLSSGVSGGAGGPYSFELNYTGTFTSSTTFSNLWNGNYAVVVKDNNNCTDTNTFTVQNTDNVPPVAKGKKNYVVSLSSLGTATITAATLDSSSSDNCAIKALSIDKNSFTCSDTGFQKIVLTATDSTNNTDTVHVYVIVKDVTKPIANPKWLSKVYVGGAGSVTFTGLDADSASFDECGIAKITVWRNAFSCADAGDTFQGNFEVRDIAGNVSSKTISVAVFDTIAPTLTVKNYTSYLNANGKDTIHFDSVFVSLTDNCTPDTAYFDAVNDTIIPVDCSKVGNNAIKIWGKDKSGNLTYKIVNVLVKDTLTPDSLKVKDQFVYLDSTGAFTLSKDSVVLYASDPCSIKDTTMKTVFNCADLGIDTVTVTISDYSGNTLSKNIKVFVIDTIKPSITTLSVDTLILDSFGNASTSWNKLFVSAYENCQIETWGLNDSIFDCGDVGTFNIFATVTDKSGNQAYDTISITVLDTLAPWRIEVMPLIDAYLDNSGNFDLSTRNVVLQALDNCIKDTIFSKTIFTCSDLDTNWVYVSILDVAGNTVTDSMRVVIHDTTLPVAIASPDTLYINTLGNVSTTAAAIGSKSYDNCGIKTMSIDNDKFYCTDAGKLRRIILTVTDNKGNIHKDTTQVLILDTVKPVLVMFNPTLQLDATGKTKLTISQVDKGSYDNCTILKRELSDTAFDCSNVGVNVVTFKVTDVNGNVSTSNFNVTVEDNIDPELTVQNTTILIDTSGKAYLKTSMVVVTATDNCGTDTILLSKYVFDLTNLGNNNVNVTLKDKNGNSVTKPVIVTVIIGDADKDSIPDYVEKNFDTDSDGTLDYLDVDSDNDGIADITENNNKHALVDTDADGKPDFRDLDADNDGINDVLEANIADANKDGIKDNAADLVTNPNDQDADGEADYRDLDSDNDALLDIYESSQGHIDLNSDGRVDGNDADNDGIIDQADAFTGFGDQNDSKPADTDSDNTGDWRDTDSDGDGISDKIETFADKDGDGKPNFRDLDSDGDLIPDTYEAGSNANSPLDTDNDGNADYLDTDSDNDNIPDSYEAGTDPKNPRNTDGDALEDYRDLDSDGDKIPDSYEAGNNANNPVDTDNDGIEDYRDLDADNDTLSDEIEAGNDPNNPVDTDNDGIDDFRDLDSDADGINDKTEGNIDTDGDGIANFRDVDSDGDEVLDSDEGTSDANGNGIPDYTDADVVIPEAFSPNNDGDNDVFYIKGLKVFNNAELIVLNRNGQVVYSSGKGYNNAWDGNHSSSFPSLGGTELPEGLYFYVFKYNGLNKEPITGNLYIKR
jgi:gliding motility-associated-like protein